MPANLHRFKRTLYFVVMVLISMATWFRRRTEAALNKNGEGHGTRTVAGPLNKNKGPWNENRVQGSTVEREWWPGRREGGRVE